METTYNIGNHKVIIRDPAATVEDKARQRERLEKACIRFMREVELAGSHVKV